MSAQSASSCRVHSFVESPPHRLHVRSRSEVHSLLASAICIETNFREEEAAPGEGAPGEGTPLAEAISRTSENSFRRERRPKNLAICFVMAMSRLRHTINELLANFTTNNAELPPNMEKEDKAGNSVVAVSAAEYLRIGIHLKNVVAEEKHNVKLRCRITGKDPSSTWYKNGEPINETSRIIINATEQFQSLEILSLNITDRGLYTIVVKNRLSHVKSQAVLYVKSESTNMPLYLSCGLALHMTSEQRKLRIKKHLENITIKVGDLLFLQVKVVAAQGAIIEYAWKKDNQMYNFLSRGTMAKRQKYIQHFHYDAKIQDSGIYTVVAKCGDCIVSSTAAVMVTKDEMKTVNEDMPGFIEQLPEQIEVREGELAVIRCKINADIETEVIILMNDELIKATNVIVERRFSSVHIRIQEARQNNAGKYCVILNNKKNGVSCKSSCSLSILVRQKNTDMEEIDVDKHLNTVFASLGSRLCLHCKFNIPDSKFYYVVWYVGQFKIERNTSEFQVICRNKDFLLYIKAFELDMEGPVTCQLRKCLHYEESVEVAITEGAIYYVPPFTLHQEIMGNPTTTERAIYEMLKVNTRLRWSANNTTEFHAIFYETDSSSDSSSIFGDGIIYKNVSTTSSFDAQLLEIDNAMAELEWHTTFSPDREENSLIGDMAYTPPPSRPFFTYKTSPVQHYDNLFMEILYCKLQEEGVHYLMVDECSSENNINISAHEQIHENVGTVTIKWETLPSHIDKSYAIELLLSTNEYAQVGVVNLPEFQIHDPSLGLLMRFRIRLVPPQDKIEEFTISITPPQNIVPHFKSTTLRALEEFDKDYTKLKPVRVLGAGSFGSVVLVKNVKGSFFAMKIIKTWTQRRREQAVREYRIMHGLHHSKLVNLYDAYFSSNEFWLVMDYLWGGELFARIVQEESFKEETAVGYVKQICEGLEYLHKKHIVHLDLKPENVVCVSPNSTEIKIIDYGISRSVAKEMVKMLCGTKEYMAPEVMNYEPLTVNVDMWSLGVMVYVMLSGVFPFECLQWIERSRRVTQAVYSYDEPALSTVSDRARNFIDSLLIKEPQSRMTVEQALQHDWLMLGPSSDVDIGKIERWRSSLQTYLANSRAKWQRAGNVVIAMNRLRGVRQPPSSQEEILRRLEYGTAV